jgi:hypothetical protein
MFLYYRLESTKLMMDYKFWLKKTCPNDREIQNGEVPLYLININKNQIFSHLNLWETKNKNWIKRNSHTFD